MQQINSTITKSKIQIEEFESKYISKINNQERKLNYQTILSTIVSIILSTNKIKLINFVDNLIL